MTAIHPESLPKDVNKFPLGTVFAMLAGGPAKKNKYVLSVVGNRVAMVRGTNIWSTWETVQDMMACLEKDPNVKLMAFTCTQAFAEWLLS